jgi:tetratricopeptide (TPR) repeat protein
MKTAKHSELYMTFHSLSNHSRVRFFEEKIKNNSFIDFREKAELEIEYIFALFEVGKYEKVLEYIDPVIELVVIENIDKINGKDAFESLLFKKSACYFNLEEYDKCIELNKQLLNINKQNNLYKHLQSLATKKKKLNGLSQINYYGVLSLFFGFVLSIIDIFIIDPFYTEYHALFSIVKDSFFTIGIVILVSQFFYNMKRKYGK